MLDEEQKPQYTADQPGYIPLRVPSAIARIYANALDMAGLGGYHVAEEQNTLQSWVVMYINWLPTGQTLLRITENIRPGIYIKDPCIDHLPVLEAEYFLADEAFPAKFVLLGFEPIIALLQHVFSAEYPFLAPALLLSAEPGVLTYLRGYLGESNALQPKKPHYFKEVPYDRAQLLRDDASDNNPNAVSGNTQMPGDPN